MRWTFARFGLHDPDPVVLRGAIDAFFAYEESCWYADPDALPMLRELSDGGLRSGMFSNATDDLFIQRLVDRFGFRRWLDPALSSAGTDIRKPDPAAFAPILAAWNLPPSSVVVVGDTLDADILGAQRAGMRSVWIRSRQDARQEGKDDGHADHPTDIVPDVAIRHLGELAGHLQGL
jgi:HAD superfamily hydrolase (TIGR01509 family)